MKAESMRISVDTIRAWIAAGLYVRITKVQGGHLIQVGGPE